MDKKDTTKWSSPQRPRKFAGPFFGMRSLTVYRSLDQKLVPQIFLKCTGQAASVRKSPQQQLSKFAGKTT